MNENIEIFNFLNVINPKLGDFYKNTGHNPLPEDFLPTEKDIKEVLLLNQMQISKIPQFLFENKKIIKKKFKNYYKNAKKLAENANKSDFSPEFFKIIEIYLNLQVILTHIFLKEFRAQDFSEVEAFKQIMQINPILSERLLPLFDDKSSIDLKAVENDYFLSYNEKIKLIEKKNNKKTKHENGKILAKNSKKTIKKVEKTQKNTQKLQNKQEVKKVKEQIKKVKERQ